MFTIYNPLGVELGSFCFTLTLSNININMTGSVGSEEYDSRVTTNVKTIDIYVKDTQKQTVAINCDKRCTI